GTLSDLFNKPGLALSVRNLLELMLLISDNSATDMLLRQAGGPSAVNERMAALGIDGIHLDRSTALLIADALGVEKLPPEEEWTLDGFVKLMRGVPPEKRKTAQQRFDADPRDTSTPDAMAQLLTRIYHKDLLKPETADLLLDIMKRCRTGDTRIKGLLPAGTELAHKTGTISASANDVSILTLPNGAGHAVLAVFLNSATKNTSLLDRAIAEISLVAHDYFVLKPAAAPGRKYKLMADPIFSSLHLRGGEGVRLRLYPGFFEEFLPP